MDGRNLTFTDAICQEFWLLIYSEGIHIQTLEYVRCNHSVHKIELLLSNSMLVEEIVNIGLVDVDFAANLGERDEALVAVVLPCLWGDAEDFSRFFGFEPVATGVASLGFLDHVGQSVKFFMQ